ncbi:MAG: hypothetical protein HY820_29355 [Acidobacteria bacterium]|nr:hypothetical protein [Acidobacteriota bacterium]
MIATDYGTPSGGVLGIIGDARAVQFWDPTRTLSKSMGEEPGREQSIVWDWVALYAPGVRWDQKPPPPLFEGRTVESAAPELATKLDEVLRR